jgi:hypothetical protein
MAIGSDSTVFFYDLNDDLLIRKINVIEKSGVPLLKGDKGQVRVEITKKGNSVNSFVFRLVVWPSMIGS